MGRTLLPINTLLYSDAVTTLAFRPYSSADLEPCLKLFEANCPAYFAANERADYEHFLAGGAPGYRVCETQSQIVGAFGLAQESGACRVQWIMISPQVQRAGLGTTMMNEALAQARRSGARALLIAASHKSAPFFARFGARTVRDTPDGWGPGMHRIDMQLELSAG
jgi:GNAT superfamily N-acetyltransferase